MEAAPGPDVEPRWLSPTEQEAWIATSGMLLLLPGALDAQLQRDAGVSLFEYFVLSRLSMAPERTLRMSELAAVANGSLSRLSNVVKRLEQRAWVRREPDPADGRFTVARLTTTGWDTVVAAAPGHVAAVRALLFDALSADQTGALTGIASAVTGRVRAEPTCAPGAAADPCS